MFCLSLAFFVFAGLFSFSPEARELFYVLSEEGCGPSQIDLSKDPKIGSAPEISIIEKMPEFAGDIFYLVFVGSCTPCHETAIKEILKSAKKNERHMVLVHYDDYDEETLNKFKEEGATTLLDANRTLHNSFNSVFLPRCYEVKRDGRISWVQKDFGINAITGKLQRGAE